MGDRQRWDDLRAFLAVARAGKLTEAARAMAVEHTTLSRRLNRLEGSLGTRLFDRRATGYGLTAEGERLLPRAEAAERAALQVWSGDLGEEAAGTVRIGSPEAFGTLCLSPRLGQLAATHPNLRIELVAMPRSFSLSKREADVAVGLSRPQSARLHAGRLTDYELGLFGSPAYLARHGTPQRLADLKQHRLIGYIDELIFAPELDYFALALPGLQPSIKISNVLTQRAAVQAGSGLCILPCFITQGLADLRRVMAGAVCFTRQYWLISHSDTRAIPRVRLALDFVRACVEEDLGRFLPDASATAAR